MWVMCLFWYLNILTLFDRSTFECVKKAKGWYSRQYGHSRSSGRHPAVFGCQTLTQLVDGSFGHPIADHACRSHKHTHFTKWAGCKDKGGRTLTKEPPCGRNTGEISTGVQCGISWNNLQHSFLFHPSQRRLRENCWTCFVVSSSGNTTGLLMQHLRKR